jgi:uncharacterized protein (DUF1015 family)
VPEIQPFPGLLYRVPEAELARVLAPPYDVIPPAYQAELYGRDPRNVVRLVLNRTEGEPGYREAGETFARWRAEGLIAADPAPALYVLEQEFEVEGARHRRLGLLARFRAEDPDRGSVLPHEQTRPAAREDRYRMLKATRANFSPILLMAADPGGRLAAGLEAAGAEAAVLTYTDDGGVLHRLRRVTEAGAIAAFVEAMAATKAYIADGHHRYATALRYRDETGPDGAWTLGYFTPLESPGLLVLPYHRILSAGPSLDEARAALDGMFLLNQADGVREAARAAAHSTMPYAFALAWPGGGALVAEALPEAEDLLTADTPPSLRALDTWFLHHAVLKPLLGVGDEAVSYVHSLGEAEEAVSAARCRLAVLMRGTPVRQIVDVAEARQSMPAKSTFFHPKLPSGLVMHPLVT